MEHGQKERQLPCPSLVCILQNLNADTSIFIFEGEKCTQAAHYLDLAALTSMGGSSQCTKADWAVLAQFRKHHRFVLVPDHDDAGKKYMRDVYDEIRKACPQAEITVCMIPLEKKGDDFVDWIQSQPVCPDNWDGYKSIDKPAPLYLRQAFERTVEQYTVPAEKYFASTIHKPLFSGPFEPMAKKVFPIKSCPIEAFPAEIRELMETLAKQMQVPVDYLAASFVIYAGSVIGRKRGIIVRKGSDWTEFANIWGMIIGRTALLKSPAMFAMQKPLDGLNTRAISQHSRLLNDYHTKHNNWKIFKKLKDEEIKKEMEKELKNQNFQLDQFLGAPYEKEPIEPKLKRYKTNDSTVEKLGELLIENPQGLLLFRDELSGWLNSFEKPGRENDRQFFLEGWSAKNSFQVDRIQRGSLYIPALCLSIFGSIQPGPLAQYIHNALYGGKWDDGFIQRFQIMVWPDAQTSWELVKAKALAHLEEKAQEVFNFLDSLEFDTQGKPVYLQYDDEAQTVFDLWQTQLESRLRTDEFPPHMEAHLAKYRKLVPTLSIIFAFLTASQRRQHPNVISKTVLNHAINWANYLESHAKKIYHSSVDNLCKRADALLKHIKKGDIQEPFSVRDVYYGKHWSGLATSDEAKEVLDYLCEQNYLIKGHVPTQGRSLEKYWVHPDILAA